jgi:hypothetical protein
MSRVGCLSVDTRLLAALACLHGLMDGQELPSKIEICGRYGLIRGGRQYSADSISNYSAGANRAIFS